VRPMFFVIASAFVLLTACSSGSSSSTQSTAGQSQVSTSPITSTSPTPVTPTPPPPTNASAPQFPVVLVHGVGGLSALRGQDVHFIDVPDRLRSIGCNVLRAQTPPFHNIDTRARSLRSQIELAFPDPTQKVNIIAHSMGGLDARYLISQLGFSGRVASLTTISTPHQGTPLADIALGIIPGPAQQVIDLLMNVFGWDWDFVHDCSEDYIRNVFNPATPDIPAVFYQSYGGKADPFGQSGGRIRTIMIPFWTLILARAGNNDGMIPLSSTHWGTWRGELPAEHADQVGIFAQPNASSNWDHLQFYEDLARDLASRGF
jgi:triacylglycerol lipase